MGGLKEDELEQSTTIPVPIIIVFLFIELSHKDIQKFIILHKLYKRDRRNRLRSHCRNTVFCI